MKLLEVAFGISGDRALDTTATTGGRRDPRLSVTKVSHLLFWSMVAADLLGAVPVLTSAV